MSYDSTKDTKEHISNVREFIDDFKRALVQRQLNHDASKLEPPEKEKLDQYAPLHDTVYGSEEYLKLLNQTDKEHHYKHNRHHPEYHENGITDMNLVDLIELLCDWKAATLRYKNGNVRQSLLINVKRHKIPDHLALILLNTIDAMGW